MLLVFKVPGTSLATIRGVQIPDQSDITACILTFDSEVFFRLSKLFYDD